MNKKNKRKGSIGLIFVLLFALAFVVTPGMSESIAASLSDEPSACIDAPYNFKCICPEDTIKTGFGKWTCVGELNLTDVNVMFPIETWEESYKFVEEQMGGIPCKGEYFYDRIGTGTIANPTYDGKYGGEKYNSDDKLCGFWMDVECMKVTSTWDDGSPKTGDWAWLIEFDPNDGYIYTRYCISENIDNCPSNINGGMFNPAYGCNDPTIR